MVIDMLGNISHSACFSVCMMLIVNVVNVLGLDCDD